MSEEELKSAPPGERKALDLEALRAGLASAQGPRYWRSLEELAETPEFLEFLHREFPENASEWTDPVGRRQFLKLMAASLALAGLSACTRAPTEKIVPYVRAPEDLIPGKPLFYATAMPLAGIATGVLVESHLGRPTKIEGNPEHPASLGASDAFGQASILTLYDPDRSQVLSNAGRISIWSNFLTALRAKLEEQRLKRGAGLRILTETVTSPTLAGQLQALLAEFPGAKWNQYEPAGRHAFRAGARLAFGEYVETRYRFDQARVILSLDADFLCSGPGSLRYAREFAAQRRVRAGRTEMNRLYVVESTPSNTGVMADHRLPLCHREVESFARGVAQRLGIATAAGPQSEGVARHAKWIEALVRDLQKQRGASVVVAGEEQPPVVHALAHAINQALDNVGRTVLHTAPVEANPVDQLESLRELVGDMEAGRVEVLLMVGGNPVYTAPADLQFAARLSKVAFRAHLSLYDDETSLLCHWHIPAAHYLESWSDARAFDGTVTLLQPLIAPLYGGKTAHEVLAALTPNPARSSYDILREYWKSRLPGPDFEKSWRKALHEGLVEGTELPPKKVTLQANFSAPAAAGAGARGLEIVFRPDPTVFDGQFANNGWLQELPKPLTKITWDNAALVSPATAQRLQLRNEDLVELRYQGRAVRAPVWVMPGHADDCVTVHLGYGRARAGRVGTGPGFDAYALRTSAAPWCGSGLEVVKTGEQYPLSVTQHHHSIEAPRERLDLIVREGTLEQYRRDPNFVREMAHEPAASLTLHPLHPYEGYAWGMAIDTSACNGCNACVVACQSENNSPIVGKVEVARGREMQWLRIDRYYKGSFDNPGTCFQPLLCMHCENAPCELVCPVAATVHSDEGLNEMVYNRCVGTRYCSNNCPYKVRRFNFFQYSDYTTPSLALMHNPDVTVRSRGVMEKCTYCVQRINVARIQSEKEQRKIRDDEVVTACQAVCPAEAIVFGNINDPNSRVSKLKAESLNYGLLADLNTRPRTSYLARLHNPNPEIEAG